MQTPFLATKLIAISTFFLLMSCSSNKLTKPEEKLVNIMPRSTWNAAEPRPYKKHSLQRITIHHEGTRLEFTADATKKLKAIQTWGMGKDRNWTDIPYHFLIAADGTIYEGREAFTVGETNTEYDPTGHLLINCLGNLNEQEVTSAQLTSLVRLIAHCSKTYKLPIETLASHRDYSKQTTCPGKNLYQYLENGYLKNEAAKLIAAK